MKKWIQFIIAIILLVIPIVIMLSNKKKLKKKGIYSIAIITKIESGPKRSYILSYRFKYQNSIYNTYDQIYKNRNDLVGARFIVRFIQKNPDITELLYDKRIWCDTLKAPYNGWKEIPAYFPFYPESQGYKNCEMYQKKYIEKLKKK
jgi:hypothetical protein